MCRRTEKDVGSTVGLPRHRHFVGLFNVPLQQRQYQYIYKTTSVDVYKHCTLTEEARRTQERYGPPNPLTRHEGDNRVYMGRYEPVPLYRKKKGFGIRVSYDKTFQIVPRMILMA